MARENGHEPRDLSPMSDEHLEITITAVATHPIHGRVIVFEESPGWVFVAPIIEAYPFYGDDFPVTRTAFERDYKIEPTVTLETKCEACGASAVEEDVPDHEISRKYAEWGAVIGLYGCCDSSNVFKMKFTWTAGRCAPR